MNRKGKIEEIQRLERELLSASPSKSARLTVKIVKRRGQVFNEN